MASPCWRWLPVGSPGPDAGMDGRQGSLLMNGCETTTRLLVFHGATCEGPWRRARERWLRRAQLRGAEVWRRFHNAGGGPPSFMVLSGADCPGETVSGRRG